jgi:hypothetical protein
MPFSNRVLEKMTSSLTFSNKKVREAVDWRPQLVKDNIDKII